MAIRWAKFPHDEIRADIYSRLNLNAVERSADDSAQHILRRRLYRLDHGEHRRFIQLESRHIVEHARCTRDAYRAFTNAKKCRPAAEAYWVILRFAVLPTAIACLRRSVFDYVMLTRIRAADLSHLFGIPTRFRHHMGPGGSRGELKPNDSRSANDTEIRALAETVSEDSLLRVEDNGVWHPCGGGPFAVDDSRAAERSWGLCALLDGMTFTEWIPLREKLWRASAPWTEGLSTLFGCVQDELLSQWGALPRDGKAQEAKWRSQPSALKRVVVPDQRTDTSGPAVHVHRVAPGVAQVSLVDLNEKISTTLRKTRRRLTELGAPTRTLKDSRILEAADYKIANPKCTFREVSIRFFGTPKRADSIRSWTNKRQAPEGKV